MTNPLKRTLNETSQSESSFKTKRTTKGNATEAQIAPRDTNFEPIKTIRKIPKQIKAAIG